MSPYDIAGLFKTAYNRTAAVQTAKKAFYSTGIWLYNSEFDFLLVKVTYRENPNEEEEDADDLISIEQLDQALEAATSSSGIVPVFELKEEFPPIHSLSLKKLRSQNQRKS